MAKHRFSINGFVSEIFDFDACRRQWKAIGKIWHREPSELEKGKIERWVLLCVTLFPLILSPITLVRSLRTRDVYWCVECYQLLMLSVLCILTFLLGHTQENFLAVQIVGGCFATWRLLDILCYLSGTVFLVPYELYTRPMSPNRNFIMLFINFIEIVLCFSILYLATNSIAMDAVPGDTATRYLECPLEAFYFSVVTITTLGYGDFGPVNSTGQLIVAIQVLVGFFFVMVIFNSFLSGAVRHFEKGG